MHKFTGCSDLCSLNKILFFRPLSMSENLAKLAQKIDFSKIPADEKKDGKKDEQRGVKRENGVDSDKGSDDSDTKEQPAYQSSLWPWDSVRNKLRFVL